MEQAGVSAELFLVSFSNAALTELRTQNLQARSSHDICTSFSLKSTGRVPTYNNTKALDSWEII